MEIVKNEVGENADRQTHRRKNLNGVNEIFMDCFLSSSFLFPFLQTTSLVARL